jgi:hypothetical protein
MSTDPMNYWQVICQCPHGHLLGTIIETGSGIGWYDRVLRDKRKVSGVPLTVGEKVKATCTSCPRDRGAGIFWQRLGLLIFFNTWSLMTSNEYFWVAEERIAFACPRPAAVNIVTGLPTS